MDFGEVLTKAWQITWKYKVLWLFGILAGCGNSSAQSNYSFGGQDFGGPSPGPENIPPELQRFFGPFSEFFNQFSEGELLVFGIIAAIIGLVFAVIVILLSTVGRIGLVRGALLADSGAETLTFGELFESVRPYFWRVLGLNLLLLIVFFIMAAVLGLMGVLFVTLTLGFGVLCLLPLVCLLIPAAWLVSLVIEQANIALIVDDLSIGDSLQRGWEVFRQNLGPVIIMGLILTVGIGLLGGFLIALPLSLIGVPVLAAILSDSQTAVTAGLVIGGICLVVLIPVLILLSGILQTYIRTAWTLTYLRLTTGGPPPMAMEAEVL